MPGAISFTAEPVYQARVDQLESQLKKRGIKVTDSARVMFALAMQAQTQASDTTLSQTQFLERLGRVPLDDIVSYYVGTYGEKKRVNFNRAFHLVSDFAYIAKFPWTPTPE